MSKHSANSAGTNERCLDSRAIFLTRSVSFEFAHLHPYGVRHPNAAGVTLQSPGSGERASASRAATLGNDSKTPSATCRVPAAEAAGTRQVAEFAGLIDNPGWPSSR